MDPEGAVVGMKQLKHQRDDQCGGDASHGLHPIAGQGLNMGLRDVAAMADVLANDKSLGLDIGEELTLRKYERWRRFDNTLMLYGTDFLNRLFSNNSQITTLARRIGLASINKCLPLKRFFTREAMGLTGNLPSLMQE